MVNEDLTQPTQPVVLSIQKIDHQIEDDTNDTNNDSINKMQASRMEL